MAQVDKDHMTELRSASDSLATAQDAEKDVQLKAVAFAINSAANTGETQAVFQGVLLPEVKSELESKGYKVGNYNSVDTTRSCLISWKNA